MGREIERKFLLRDDRWRAAASAPVRMRQGYLSTDRHRTVRIRCAGEAAFITIKGITCGNTRAEFEYPIPLIDANEMLDELCFTPLIEKDRYCVEYSGLIWEVDEFFGDNTGLLVAEVELDHERQDVQLPPWVGDEVSGQARYYNANLITHPFKDW